MASAFSSSSDLPSFPRETSNGGCIQRVGHVRQLALQAFADVALPVLHNQMMGQFGMDTSVSKFVGIDRNGMLNPLATPPYNRVRMLASRDKPRCRASALDR